jgi:hypothetical protein
MDGISTYSHIETLKVENQPSFFPHITFCLENFHILGHYRTEYGKSTEKYTEKYGEIPAKSHPEAYN